MSSRREVAQAARSRIWAIWIFYLLGNGPGALIQAMNSGEWAGFLSGWAAVALLSCIGANTDRVVATRVFVASAIGASVQTKVVQGKRRALGITTPDEADVIYLNEPY